MGTVLWILLMHHKLSLPRFPSYILFLLVTPSLWCNLKDSCLRDLSNIANWLSAFIWSQLFPLALAASDQWLLLKGRVAPQRDAVLNRIIFGQQRQKNGDLHKMEDKLATTISTVLSFDCWCDLSELNLNTLVFPRTLMVSFPSQTTMSCQIFVMLSTQHIHFGLRPG